MASNDVSMQQLLEAGAHFGHQTHRWNPKMKPYIFGERNGVHIIDLSQTVPLLRARARFRAADRRRRRQGALSSAPSARRRSRSPRPRAARASISSTIAGWAACSPTGRPSPTRSSASRASRSSWRATPPASPRRKCSSSPASATSSSSALGGIRDMGGIPDVMFVIDANKEELAIKEANVLGIPVVAMLDSNVSPQGIAFPVPGNDDASRAIRLYCDAIADAVLGGKQGGAVGARRGYRRPGRAAGRSGAAPRPEPVPASGGPIYASEGWTAADAGSPHSEGHETWLRSRPPM